MTCIKLSSPLQIPIYCLYCLCSWTLIVTWLPSQVTNATQKMELLNWSLRVSRRQIPAWHFLYWQSLSCFYCLCFEVLQAPDLPQRLRWQSLPYYILWGYPWLPSNKEENTTLTLIMLRITQALISLIGWEQDEHIVMGTQQNKKFARNVCATPGANWDQL